MLSLYFAIWLVVGFWLLARGGMVATLSTISNTLNHRKGRLRGRVNDIKLYMCVACNPGLHSNGSRLWSCWRIGFEMKSKRTEVTP